MLVGSYLIDSALRNHFKGSISPKSFNNDIGVGYWLFKSPQSFFQGIVPTLEGHLYAPLDHRSSADLIYASNIFTVSSGVNFVMPNYTTLGAAFSVPVTGPRPNNVEGLVSFNLRF